MPVWITKIESKTELKEIDIKNGACYYFDDIFNVTDINFSDILLAKKLWKYFSLWHFVCPKPSRIRFNNIDGFIMVLDG